MVAAWDDSLGSHNVTTELGDTQRFIRIKCCTHPFISSEPIHVRTQPSQRLDHSRARGRCIIYGCDRAGTYTNGHQLVLGYSWQYDNCHRQESFVGRPNADKMFAEKPLSESKYRKQPVGWEADNGTGWGGDLCTLRVTITARLECPLDSATNSGHG